MSSVKGSMHAEYTGHKTHDQVNKHTKRRGYGFSPATYLAGTDLFQVHFQHNIDMDNRNIIWQELIFRVSFSNQCYIVYWNLYV